MDLTPQDRDLLIRTVIGEAANEPPAGQAGVAYSVLNRLHDGGYGNSVKDILFSPKQYEPWDTRSKELMSYTPDNPTYQKIRQVVDGVISGKIKDPTNGATHFANVDVVKQRGNTSALNWINQMQDVSKIGSHTFGKADAGRSMAQNEYSDLINEFGTVSAAKAPSDKTNYDDLITQFGDPNKTIGVKPEIATAPTQAPSQPMIGNRPLQPGELDFSKKPDSGQGNSEFYERTVKPISEAPGQLLDYVKHDFTPIKDAAEGLQSAKDLASKGVQQIQQQQPASGVGNLGLAALTGVANVTGVAPASTEISKAVTNLTGNPDIGEKAGMVATSGLPFVGATNKLAKALIPSEKAIDAIASAIPKEKLAEGIERMRANPRLSLYDVFPEVKQMAQKLITTAGPHQTNFVNSVEERAGTSKGAISAALDQHLGAPVDVAQKLDDLKEAARTTGKTVINPIVENAGLPADVTNVVDKIDDLISKGGPVEKASLKALKGGDAPSLPLSDAQKELWSIRQQLRGNWPDRDAMFLDVKGEQGAHSLQSQLRTLAEDYAKSPIPADRRISHKIYDIRNSLVEAIDDSAPGYKNALKKYADDKDVEKAFTHGTTILKTSSLEDRPEFWKRWISNASDAEVEAAKEGARIALDQQLRAYAHGGRKGMNIPEIDFNVDKLSALFGKKEAETLFRKLRDERDMAQSNSDLIRGSQTAMRMKADERVDVPQRTAFNGMQSVIPAAAVETANIFSGGVPGAGAALFAATKLGHHLKETGSIHLAKARNSAITRLLTARGSDRDELLNILSNRIGGTKGNLLQRSTRAITNAVGQP